MYASCIDNVHADQILFLLDYKKNLDDKFIIKVDFNSILHS